MSVSNDTKINKFTYMANLYDFYAPLLTKKQAASIEMYYCENMSLSEIAEINGITRQAASILIGRTERLLTDYEKRLSLYDKHLKDELKKRLCTEILEALISEQTEDGVRQGLKKALEILRTYP